MSEIRQRINKSAFGEAITARGLAQAEVAAKLGVNPKSFSRWLNEGHIQSRYLWDLADAIDFSDDELSEILMSPKYRVYFRRKRLAEPPEAVREAAIDLARAVFGLTHLGPKSKFVPPDLSRFDEIDEVAAQIRRSLRIDDFNDLPSLLTRLSERGIEVIILPFKRFELLSDGENEAAFSATDGSRFLVFLDTAAPEAALIFNLCHELAHIFRPEHSHSKEEERFCNDVASELVYPRVFFEKHREEIEERLSDASFERIVPLLKVIRHHLGGELFGLTLRLRALGFMSQKNTLHNAILAWAKKTFERSADLQDIHAGFSASERDALLKFWDEPAIESNPLFRFYALLKNATIDGSISSRRLSEVLDLNLEWADELVYRWRAELKQELSDI
ncbi:hypothetical protein KAI87_16645 [Myxococcota bacterium]|nr:hypothetical protein [Myxococcota bacterium]